MLPLGIAVALGGYVLIYYGERLWVGEPVTMAEAVGLSSSSPAAPSSPGSSGGGFWQSIGSVVPFLGGF